MKGMGLRGRDRVIGMLLVRREAEVLTVTENGLGRRTSVDEFPRQNRGGLGTLALPAGEEGGALVSALEVVGGEEIVVISAGGQVSRVKVADVAEQHRRSRGRNIVKLQAGDRVVEVTRASGPGKASGSGGSEGGEDVESEVDREQIELLS